MYNHQNPYLNVSVWNTEKRDTKQNHQFVWCCTRALEAFPRKAVPIPGLCACLRCSPAGWLSDPRAVYRSFRPQRRDVSIWRFRFLRSCCVEWFSRWLVLRLFPLPYHVVCHTFVLVRAALDQTGYASNSALSVFFLCQLKCCNASKAHWSHVLSAFTIITISIWMSVCSVLWKTEKRDTI